MSRLNSRLEKKSNPELVSLARKLQTVHAHHNSPLWKDVAKRLSSSRSNWPSVNLSKLERYSKEGDVLLVPGKLLGSGKISKKVKVAAFAASKSAVEKLNSSGSEFMSIDKLAEANPKGTGIKIIS
jgi:large subunit ribosomal protein L18e